MNVKQRIAELEGRAAGKPQKVIPLYAGREIPGKGSYDNFSQQELEQVKSKYRDLYPDRELLFFVVQYAGGK